VGWAFVGLIVAALLVNGTFGVNQLADVEDAFGFACRQLLFPGALGLLIASVLAATMAASSAFMVNSGALFTEGLYRRHIVKDRPDGHYLWVGRLSGFLITMLAVLYAVLLINRVLYSFLLTETMATFMGISILGGMIWRRATRWGALASLIVAFATNFAVYRWRDQRFDHWDPTVFLIALVAGIAALVLVSLATRPEPAAAMDSFFTRLETPTELPGRTGDPLATGEPQDRTEIGRATAAAGQQLLLLNLIAPMRATYGHSFWRSYGVDLRGFAMGLLWSLLLVGLTWLILRL
jgi:Na+/proline symporter